MPGEHAVSGLYIDLDLARLFAGTPSPRALLAWVKGLEELAPGERIVLEQYAALRMQRE